VPAGGQPYRRGMPDASSRRRWVIERGVESEAEVLAVEETGWTRGHALGVQVRLTVSIEPEGRTPFRSARPQWVGRGSVPSVGDRILVRYDPADEDLWAWVGSCRSAASGTVQPIDVARLHPAEEPSDRLQTLDELRGRGVLSRAEYELQRSATEDEI
jgi:hypothetical protein